MTIKELITELALQNTDLNVEAIVSIEDQVHSDPDSMPIQVSVDYVGGQFINVTIV